MDEETDLIILGRKIGTHTGWDQHDSFICVFYDFEPAAGIDIPSGDLQVLYDRGLLELCGDEGEVTWSGNAIDVLKDALKAEISDESDG